jgi:methyl-accepting chemotaxis protein
MIRRLKIRNRLAMGFGLMAALMAVITILGVYRLSQLSNTASTIVERHWTSADLDNKIIGIANQNARPTLRLLLISDSKEAAEIVEQIQKSRAGNTENYTKLEKLLSTEEEKDLFARVIKARTVNSDSFNKVSKLLVEEKKHDEAAKVMTQETIPVLDAYLTALQQFVDSQCVSVAAACDSARKSFQSTRTASIILGVIAVLLGLSSAVWITTSITRPLKHAVSIASDIARGDMSSEICAEFSDEVG